MGSQWLAWTSEREKRELQEWWDERVKKAEEAGKTPVQWQPRGQLRWPAKKRAK